MILAAHVLTVRGGEVYLHHFWLLVFIAYVFANLASGRSK